MKPIKELYVAEFDLRRYKHVITNLETGQAHSEWEKFEQARQVVRDLNSMHKRLAPKPIVRESKTPKLRIV